MAVGIKVCKVCGRQYEACHTLRPNLNSEFRWNDVACCPEHGAEYFRQIMISRGELAEEKQEERDVSTADAAAEPAAERARPQKNHKNRKNSAKAE